MISSNEKKFYNKNGYLIKKKFFKKIFRKELFKILNEILIKQKITTPKNKYDWEHEVLNKKLILLRKRRPKIFSKIYDIIQKTVSIKKILIDSKIPKLASIILNEKNKTICEINTILRMDPPNDNRNSLGWHQDGSLIKNTFNQSCVIWVPLLNINENNGAIDLLLKSHKKKGPTRGFYQNKIEKKFDLFSAQINEGDVLIINNRTIHRSGINKSKKIRFTLRSRFNKLP